jgi:hypothetical protein
MRDEQRAEEGTVVNKFVRVAAALLAMAAASDVKAETFHRTTHEGVAVTVSGHASWDKNCVAAPSPIDIVSQPQHGVLSIAQATSPITRVGTGAAHCIGTSILTNAVIYTPAQGFRGIDKFSYTSTTASGVVLPHQAIVEVR